MTRERITSDTDLVAAFVGVRVYRIFPAVPLNTICFVSAVATVESWVFLSVQWAGGTKITDVNHALTVKEGVKKVVQSHFFWCVVRIVYLIDLDFLWIDQRRGDFDVCGAVIVSSPPCCKQG